jgi:hypothetical protein
MIKTTLTVILLILITSCKQPEQKTIYTNLVCTDSGVDVTLKPNEIRVIYDGVYEYFLSGEHIMVSGNCVLKTLEK